MIYLLWFKNHVFVWEIMKNVFHVYFIISHDFAASSLPPVTLESLREVGGVERSLLFCFTLLNVLKWKKSLYLQVNFKKLFKYFKQFQDVLLLMPATQRRVFKWEPQLLTFLTLGLKMKLSQNQNTCQATPFSGSQTFLIPLHLSSSSEATNPLASLALPHQCVIRGHWTQEMPALGLGLGQAFQCWAGFGGFAGLSSLVSAVKNGLSILFHCLLLVWPWASYFIFWDWFLLCEMRRASCSRPLWIDVRAAQRVYLKPYSISCNTYNGKESASETSTVL